MAYRNVQKEETNVWTCLTQYCSAKTSEEDDDPIPVVLSKTDRYDMSRSKNGCAIIFNFEEFQDSKKHEPREGSQKDVDRLVKVFGNLNIDIGDRVYKNMTYNSMQKKLEEFLRMKPLLSDSNSLIVVILSHGKDGDRILAHDTEFHLYDLINMFTPEKLKEMAVRPKIFIVQACRGEKVDSGTIIKPTEPAAILFDRTDAAPPEEVSVLQRYPSYADLCIAHSSYHGHYSFRNPKGSWFIQYLCDVFQKFDLKNNHLLDILAATNGMVAMRDSKSADPSKHEKKQISGCYTTLTKKFYLTRGG